MNAGTIFVKNIRKCSVTEGGFWRQCAEGGGFRIQPGLMCIFTDNSMIPKEL
jgi:hypothetical protein